VAFTGCEGYGLHRLRRVTSQSPGNVLKNSSDPGPLKGTACTGCGKTPCNGPEVSGHDFSRAVSCQESARASAPAGEPPSEGAGGFNPPQNARSINPGFSRGGSAKSITYQPAMDPFPKQEVSGHDFSRAAKPNQISRASAPAERSMPEGAVGFNPRIKSAQSTPASAAEDPQNQ